MIQHDMKLPDAILTFKLLDGAHVTDDEWKLALTMSSNLNFEGMKLALKRLFVPHPTHQKHDDTQLNKKKHFIAKNTINMIRKIEYIPVIGNQIINKIHLITRAKYCDVLCVVQKCTGQITVHIIHNQSP